MILILLTLQDFFFTYCRLICKIPVKNLFSKFKESTPQCHAVPHMVLTSSFTHEGDKLLKITMKQSFLLSPVVMIQQTEIAS